MSKRYNSFISCLLFLSYVFSIWSAKRIKLFSLLFSELGSFLVLSLCLASSVSATDFHILLETRGPQTLTVTWVQHKACVLIQLYADSLLPFACWSLCLVCLFILMLINLMLILIKSRSMLIIYWLGDRKLINAYLTKFRIQNIHLVREFLCPRDRRSGGILVFVLSVILSFSLTL